jgi:ribosomal protein S18 acetylase RimI-like enzyme
VSEKLPFSKRHGYAPQDREITIRHEAPAELRAAVLQIAVDEAELTPSTLRQIVCSVLRVLPNKFNWSDYPNVWDEVQGLVENADWYKIYDIIEKIHRYLLAEQRHSAELFEAEINSFFRERGIGWKLVNGTIEARGPEAVEEVVHQAKQDLVAAGLPTAHGELHEAIRDLSRLPEPDKTGAVQHAMAALECVAREATGDAKATLGEIVKRYPNLLPQPMDAAVEKAWGYASQVARHLSEGKEPEWEEAQATVGLAAVVATYLVGKLKHR